ncbi:hypothetical protein EDD86DRAFT_195033 [Gorgonomyces haynaldii]|nr:hypothetical protein EDD86DRAFT_195033 [Gorgonomyces haynaldii]
MIGQIATTSGLFFLGDVMAQKLVEQKEYDPVRSLRLSLFGFSVVGPSMVLWYRFLNRHIVFKSPTQTLLARVSLDQLVFSPVFLTIFFGFNGWMEGKSYQQIKQKLDDAYWDALKANWTVWPAFQLFNFRFVPLQYQVVTVNTVALGWNTFLSYKQHQ